MQGTQDAEWWEKAALFLRRNPGLTEGNSLMIFSRGALMISSSFPGKQ
jgi:hypothetical protein